MVSIADIIFTDYFYFNKVILFFYSYKWDVDRIVKALLFISESNDEKCQTILTDLLASLLILLSGEPNHQFDRHIRIIQYFLTQVQI